MTNIPPKEPAIRKRHIMVTIWLGYILVSGISSILSFSIFKPEIEKLLQVNFPSPLHYYLIGIGALNALGALFLLLWKKAGFHLLIVSNIISLYLSIQMGASVGSSILGLAQIGLTYMILQMPSQGRSTWSWLK